jgi:hypothetical protein
MAATASHKSRAVNLSPKAISALVDIKKVLLSKETSEPVQRREQSKCELRFTTMRHARIRGEAWQRYKRQGGW